jgi:hypothetical protein
MADVASSLDIEKNRKSRDAIPGMTCKLDAGAC